jgi:hypothetical protein
MGDSGDDLALDYLAVRKLVGLLGLLLPFALLFFGRVLFGMGTAPTISDYHGTPVRDVFVGILCATGVFLWSYRRHAREDGYASQFAGLFAVVVALFPNTGSTAPVHLAAAFLFFFTLALLSIFRFTKFEPGTAKEDASGDKLHRNVVYLVCGWGILLCLALIGAYLAWLKGPMPWLGEAGIVFWLESAAVWFFGVSWLVKGDALAGALVPKPVKTFFHAGQASPPG